MKKLNGNQVIKEGAATIVSLQLEVAEKVTITKEDIQREIIAAINTVVTDGTKDSVYYVSGIFAVLSELSLISENSFESLVKVINQIVDNPAKEC